MSAVVWEGPAELRPLLVPAADLRPHPRNPRRGNVHEIARSLRRFGQVRAIVVRKQTMEIVAGNHTFRAGVEELGWTHIAAHVIDLDEHEAEAYLLADNRLAELATYDREELASLLAEHADLDTLDGTGWAHVDVDAIRAELEQRVGNEPAATGGTGTSSSRLPQSGQARETVLQMDADHHARFHEWVRGLAREYGVEGVSETVYRAVEEASKRR